MVDIVIRKENTVAMNRYLAVAIATIFALEAIIMTAMHKKHSIELRGGDCRGWKD